MSPVAVDLEMLREGGGAPLRRPSVGTLLHRAFRAERRRCVAWLLAGAVTVAGALALGSDTAALTAVAGGAGFGLWAARQAIGIDISRRDFLQASTPPRRVYVVLLDDINPHAWRPLLAVWSEQPPVGARLPKPESVWRCDDELEELLSHQRFAEVHEAWLDTGPRERSTPRWVCADAGIAVPHRRAMLGRWYVHKLLRADRPGEPLPLTIDDPHTVPETGEELPREGSLLGFVALRIGMLAAFAVLVVVLT